MTLNFDRENNLDYPSEVIAVATTFQPKRFKCFTNNPAAANVKTLLADHLATFPSGKAVATNLSFICDKKGYFVLERPQEDGTGTIATIYRVSVLVRKTELQPLSPYGISYQFEPALEIMTVAFHECPQAVFDAANNPAYLAGPSESWKQAFAQIQKNKLKMAVLVPGQILELTTFNDPNNTLYRYLIVQKNGCLRLTNGRHASSTANLNHYLHLYRVIPASSIRNMLIEDSEFSVDGFGFVGSILGKKKPAMLKKACVAYADMPEHCAFPFIGNRNWFE